MILRYRYEWIKCYSWSLSWMMMIYNNVDDKSLANFGAAQELQAVKQFGFLGDRPLSLGTPPEFELPTRFPGWEFGKSTLASWSCSCLFLSLGIGSPVSEVVFSSNGSPILCSEPGSPGSYTRYVQQTTPPQALHRPWHEIVQHHCYACVTKAK